MSIAIKAKNLLMLKFCYGLKKGADTLPTDLNVRPASNSSTNSYDSSVIVRDN